MLIARRISIANIKISADRIGLSYGRSENITRTVFNCVIRRLIAPIVKYGFHLKVVASLNQKIHIDAVDAASERAGKLVGTAYTRIYVERFSRLVLYGQLVEEVLHIERIELQVPFYKVVDVGRSYNRVDCV